MSKFEKVKEILFGKQEEVLPAVFMDVKSGDLILRVDGELVVDSTVAQVIVAEDGTETIEPLEDGKYPMEDGQILVVENSTIKEILPAEVAPEVEAAVVVETPEIETPEVKVDIKELILAFEERFVKLEERVSVLEAEKQKMAEEFQKFAAAPAAPAPKFIKSGFEGAKIIESNLDSISKIRKTI